MKSFYTRKVKSNGIRLYQLITPFLVFSLYKNTSTSNGIIKNWTLEAINRINTAL